MSVALLSLSGWSIIAHHVPVTTWHFILVQVLVKGEPNISYICSRYYRAPELIFGATDYTAAIDIWSVGCVLAELMLGQPMFPGTVTECLPLLGLLWGCNACCQQVHGG